MTVREVIPRGYRHRLARWKRWLVGLLLPGWLAGQTAAGFERWWWFEPGLEHGNPMPNRRFRVNAPEAVLHPKFGSRNETFSSGMMQIRMPEDPRLLEGADLYLELWGGHPGTANKRVTINGRSTYAIAEVGTASKHCTHQYPVIRLKPSDLVNGYNALQFACDQGTTFWGHFIVDNACLRARLKPDHPDLVAAGLVGFAAAVEARPHQSERMVLELRATAPERIAGVDYQGYYRGYNENGAIEPFTWHGFTKHRRPEAYLGRATEAPFRIVWDQSMLPAQEGAAVRAIVHFREFANLVYTTAPLEGLRIPPRPDHVVELYPARELPAPFWSRAGRRQHATIDLDVEPERIERAELHIVLWDGGRGSVEHPVTLNGHPVPAAGEGEHDVLYRRLEIEPRLLRRSGNRVEIFSDTEHHGIEVLLPGPALMIRARAR